jgi:peptidoglycan/LPS O-acetylase OafA/YrhL
MVESAHYMPQKAEIDGLRALSVLIVITAHMQAEKLQKLGSVRLAVSAAATGS